MLILVEGVDGAGKTVFVDALAQTIKTMRPHDSVKVLRKGPPTEHPLDEYERPLFDYRPGAGRHIICDRWHLGEWVYPEVLDRATQADPAVLRHIELFLQSRGAVVVHVDPGLERTVANLLARGDDTVTSDQVPRLHELYDQAVRNASLPVVRYSYDAATTRLTVQTARTHELDRESLADFVTYVGPPRPYYLVLGDVRHELRHVVDAITQSGGGEHTRVVGPAFGPYPGTSGHFLLSHLPVELTSQFVGIANACDVDDVGDLWRRLGKPVVVALGWNAHNRLTEINVPHGAVPHPQYVRRFHNKHDTAYGGHLVYSALYGVNALHWRPTPERTTA